jgi:predicted nucleic acid-binding protein
VIVLDTNVISELIKPQPDDAVLAWADGQRSAEMVITAITAAELRAGAATMPAGRRKTSIIQQIDRLIGTTFSSRVLPFDVESSAHYGDVVARRRRAGAPISVLDAQIAAICRVHNAPLATRNGKDFKGAGVHLVDPWKPAET